MNGVKFYLFLITTFCIYLPGSGQERGNSSWTYIQIDSTKQKWGDWADPDWLRYFGLDAGDVDRDGNVDIISGRYVYHNPGGAMQGAWKRTVLDDNVDGILFVDVDGDAYADIIAQALPDIYWLEATNLEGTEYRIQVIGQIPATSHVNSQGFEKAQILKGGMQEFVIAGNGDVYCFSIPDENPENQSWKIAKICENTSDEGIGIGDIDGDGDQDIAAGRRPAGEDEPTILMWYENPGTIDQLWKARQVGTSEHPIDRVEVADINGDGKADIVMTEERYPGLKPDANMFWFEQNTDVSWQRHLVVRQYSMNNLGVVDIDGDQDHDIITAEHKGDKLELQLWLNDGEGNLKKEVLDTGKENHLGTKLADLDGDGDLDIFGAGWDRHRFMHVWRNDAVKHLKTGDVRGSGQSSDSPNQKFSEAGNMASNAGKMIKETTYQGRPHFVVRTPKITYYYDRAGGGFSRIIDEYGNDWVGFKKDPWNQYPASAASSYRGLPNMVFKSDDGGAGHPGFDKCESELGTNNTIISKSKSGKWEWHWTFFDDHAILDIIKTDPNVPYWFLYEGTPGGKYDIGNYFYGTNVAGPKSDTPDLHNATAVFGKFKWAYFGRKPVDNTLFLAQVKEDDHIDLLSYLGNSGEGVSSEDGMTVFGFGRDKNTNPLMSANQKFIVGIYDHAVRDGEEHRRLSKYINTLITKYQ